MYKINRGLTEWHIYMPSFFKEFINKCKIFDINPSNVKFYSQQDEDKYIIQYLLKEKISDGTFLEVGCERQRGNEVWLNKNYFRKHLFNC